MGNDHDQKMKKMVAKNKNKNNWFKRKSKKIHMPYPSKDKVQARNSGALLLTVQQQESLATSFKLSKHELMILIYNLIILIILEFQ